MGTHFCAKINTIELNKKLYQSILPMIVHVFFNDRLNLELETFFSTSTNRFPNNFKSLEQNWLRMFEIVSLSCHINFVSLKPLNFQIIYKYISNLNSIEWHSSSVWCDRRRTKSAENDTCFRSGIFVLSFWRSCSSIEIECIRCRLKSHTAYTHTTSPQYFPIPKHWL